jgi:hypothetical protein
VVQPIDRDNARHVPAMLSPGRGANQPGARLSPGAP